MPGKTVTLTIPNPLYDRIQQRAEHTRRSIHDELLNALALAVPAPDDVPADIAQKLAYLDALDDATLWRAARTRLSRRDNHRLTKLNDKAQREGLTEAEAHEQAALLDRGEDVMLIRAKAALLLKQRGHDISELIPNT